MNCFVIDAAYIGLRAVTCLPSGEAPADHEKAPVLGDIAAMATAAGSGKRSRIRSTQLASARPMPSILRPRSRFPRLGSASAA
jgi:hypothetical protein